MVVHVDVVTFPLGPGLSLAVTNRSATDLDVAVRRGSDRFEWNLTTPFIELASGGFNFKESEGNFDMATDRSSNLTTWQTVDTVTTSGGAVSLGGRLGRGSGPADAGVVYNLTFLPDGLGSLDFDLVVNASSPWFNRLILSWAIGEDEDFFGFGEQVRPPGPLATSRA